MKSLVFLSILCVFLIFGCKSCTKKNKEENISSDLIYNPNTANSKQEKKGLPKFLFEKNSHDFGKVIQGEKVSFVFLFKNIGESDLLISSANASCGCTVPKFTKTPVLPGKNGSVEVIFNSNGKEGFQEKTVTIVANTQPNTYVLTIKAMVFTPEEK